jgi:hypothetical protein
LPVVALRSAAFDNFETTRLTKLGLAFTLRAKSPEHISGWLPRLAMRCTAMENCVFTAAMIVILIVTERKGKDFLEAATHPKKVLEQSRR